MADPDKTPVTMEELLVSSLAQTGKALTLGSDQAKPLLFQGLFARERCYLALEAHFPYRNGRHKAAPALEEYTNRPPPKPRDVVL